MLRVFLKGIFELITRQRVLVLILLCQSMIGCAGSYTKNTIKTMNIVPLVTTLEDNVADDQVIPIRFNGEDVWLALDTGAPFTFLFSDPDGPEYIERAGTIEIGCEKRELSAYRDDAIGVEMFRGKPIIGILGLDFFLDVPAEIDYPGGRLVRYLDRKLPESYLELPELPLRGREQDRALVKVTLDGTELTLTFDTGAHDTVLIDAVGAEGDGYMQVQTADGRRWDVLVGEATLALPGEKPRPVTVLRAQDLEYIAPEMREIGSRGLLGLTSLGWRRVVLDFENDTLKLGPLCNPSAP